MPTQYGPLQRGFHSFYKKLSGRELAPCLITLQSQKKVMGYFSRRCFVEAVGTVTDEIAILFIDLTSQTSLDVARGGRSSSHVALMELAVVGNDQPDRSPP